MPIADQGRNSHTVEINWQWDLNFATLKRHHLHIGTADISTQAEEPKRHIQLAAHARIDDSSVALAAQKYGEI